jgi:outer membrane lipoprotein-sorting protein
MRMARFVLSILLILAFSRRLDSQQIPSTPVPKDPQALEMAQKSLLAMSGTTSLNSILDSQTTGTLTLYAPDGPVSMPITYNTKGTHQIRVELQQPAGMAVRIVNNGQGILQKPDGSIVNLLMNNTLAERVTHIPVFSLLAENLDPAVKVQSKGSSTVNNSVTNDVVLSYIPNPASPDASAFEKMTQHIFHLDQSTGLVLKVDYQNCAENDTNACQKVETVFSDYRSVQGVLVPFLQTTSTDGKPYSQVALKSVSFNVGLSDSLFSLVK